ncbi:MAG: HEAT repeat domain-containing protein [Candidatus Eremiobacteraeota bacterium]|nr:HEAT repeat domain-containing protein [Candidatus Eremiobacteraeota bacterium]
MHPSLVAFVSAAVLALSTTVPASSTTAGNIVRESAILHSSASLQAKKNACESLASDLLQHTSVAAKSVRTETGDRAFSALRQFILMGTDNRARAQCARDLVDASSLIALDKDGRKISSGYGNAAITVAIQLLRDSNTQMRISGTKALYGISEPSVGRALLRIARIDPSNPVRSAAFYNMVLSMKADVVTTHDEAAYKTAISQALKNRDTAIVVSGLYAYAGLYGMSADTVLRRYAADARPQVRAGAIAAYDGMMGSNNSMERFIESRLNDPDASVRSQVLLRLLRMGDTHALPAMKRLARTAPTGTERKEAEQYIRALEKNL